MRTLTLGGLYIAPVAAFAVIAVATGYSEQLVDYSEFEGQSVAAELYEFDGEKVLDLVTTAEQPSKSETATTYVAVASANETVVKDDYTSVLYKDTFFGFQDVSVEAIAAEFDDLIDSAASKPGILVNAATTNAIQSVQAPALNTPLTRAVQTAVASASFNNSSFGGSGGIGNLGGTGVAAFTPASGISNPAATDPNPVFPLPTGSGIVPVTAGLSVVPLPASALLLLAGLVLFGVFRGRQQA